MIESSTPGNHHDLITVPMPDQIKSVLTAIFAPRTNGILTETDNDMHLINGVEILIAKLKADPRMSPLAALFAPHISGSFIDNELLERTKSLNEFFQEDEVAIGLAGLTLLGDPAIHKYVASLIDSPPSWEAWDINPLTMEKFREVLGYDLVTHNDHFPTMSANSPVPPSEDDVFRNITGYSPTDKVRQQARESLENGGFRLKWTDFNNENVPLDMAPELIDEPPECRREQMGPLWTNAAANMRDAIRREGNSVMGNVDAPPQDDSGSLTDSQLGDIYFYIRMVMEEFPDKPVLLKKRGGLQLAVLVENCQITEYGLENVLLLNQAGQIRGELPFLPYADLDLQIIEQYLAKARSSHS